MKLRPVDMKLLPQTYPLPKRILCWIVWKLPPISWIVRGCGIRSPYRKVVAICEVRPGGTESSLQPGKDQLQGDKDA